MTSAHGYPRPQLERANWSSLDGTWDFIIDRDARWTLPDQVEWNGGTILVPFAPECEASGVHEPGFFRSCWYHRLFDAPELAQGERVLLHFGAVDYSATV